MMRYSFLIFLAGCCNGVPPEWITPTPTTLGSGGSLSLDLRDLLAEGDDSVRFEATPGTGLSAEISGSTLTLNADASFGGSTEVRLSAIDSCGSTAETSLIVTVDPLLSPNNCDTTFTYQSNADAVYIAGSFNDWDARATPLSRAGDTWTTTLSLPAGAWTYKVVETRAGQDAWSCDPEAEFFQCDEGYTWDPVCSPGAASCNSMIIVADCQQPQLSVTDLKIDRENLSVDATVSVQGQLSSPTATLDGSPIEAWDGTQFSVHLTGLSAGRHTLRLGGTAANGLPVTEAYIPFWLDEGDWDRGLLYYAFVDRFENGDTTNDRKDGATGVGGDWQGGDWQGVMDRLDYLDDLGVTTIWLTAPWDGANGSFNGDCGVTLTAYHGYWPISDTALEEHFGDAAQLDALVTAAHARHMRVLVDWVGNHVHSDHPWVTEHPDWFSQQYICQEDEDGNGVTNWDQRPETCWFASYLPDIYYYNPEPLNAMVGAAIDFAKRYDIDGFRVDAAKHMPHSVQYNLQSRIKAEIEHRDAGGDQDFYTVGETFSGDRGLIASYIGEDELDGQFDFPLYWAVVAAFARDEIGLSNGDGSLASVVQASQLAWGDAKMSIFLGNHDVWRFIGQAAGQVGNLYGDGNCDASNHSRAPAVAPGWSEPYDRLKLAWSFLLTQSGMPLIYYGDEIGLPGYADPDNRQLMRFDSSLSAEEADVLAQVQALGQARRDHLALAAGSQQDWWANDADIWAYARRYEDDAALVLLNRSQSSRSLSNGLAFAGLPQGRYQDVLDGSSYQSAGDNLTVDIPALGSRVLVYMP